MQLSSQGTMVLKLDSPSLPYNNPGKLFQDWNPIIPDNINDKFEKNRLALYGSHNFQNQGGQIDYTSQVDSLKHTEC
jgi:hypothetical protein